MKTEFDARTFYISRRLSAVLFVVFFLLLEASCTIPAGAELPRTLRIMSYNVQNLFDDRHDGGEYSEFIPGKSSGWNREAYRARLGRLAGVIRDAANLPDVIILIEIENRKVLEDLRDGFLPAGSYPYLEIQDQDEGLIHIGMLSRLPPQAIRSHRIWLGGENTRSIWELWFAAPVNGKVGEAVAPGDPGLHGFVLFANHWKSKSGGGEAATEALRRLAGKTLSERANEIRKNWPNVDMLACGDLNEIIHESGSLLPQTKKQKRSRSIANANSDRRLTLIRDDKSWDGQGMWPIRGQEEFEFAASHRSEPVWYSPWTQQSTDLQGNTGSYYFGGAWEAIDHFLMAPSLFDGNGWSWAGFQVIKTDSLLTSDGIPRRYDTRTQTGYSDHVPILLELKPAGKLH